MKKSGFILLAFLLSVLLIVLLFVKGGITSDSEPERINPDFVNYVSQRTSGYISSESTIQIVLASEFPEAGVSGTKIEKDLFSFSPSIKGTAYWLNSRTIEFTPDKNLPSGKLITGVFKLGELMEVPEGLEEFPLRFNIINQSFSVEQGGMVAYEKNKMVWNKLGGTVYTADVINPGDIEQVLKAKQGGKDLKIVWEHSLDRKTHTFYVDSIERKETAEIVSLDWDGDEIDIDISGKKEIEIPALGDFKVMAINVVQEPSQYISIEFSDPLLQNQNLTGLITLANGTNLSYLIKDNIIEAYPASRERGSIYVTVNPGIKNILGYNYEEILSQAVTFDQFKPAVELIGNGIIIPNSNGLVFPFRAVSLRAVDVRVIKVYENNVGRFLQDNRLSGSRDLRRVARLVKKKTIPLTSDKPLDYGTWGTYSLDLSDMIKSEPGAIYQVSIGFRKQHALYRCSDADEEQELTDLTDSWDGLDEEDEEEWDRPYSYYYYDDDYYDYYDDYDWREREDPCKDSYYRNRSVSRNVLASDLGLIAKGSQNGKVNVAVTNLITTQPESDVVLELYNYQLQKIKTSRTNAEGLASIDANRKPYLLIAKKGNQRGYMRLDDGSSLSLSKFDVWGERIEKGVKGYIYTERGVWRPGDSVYVMFVLEDKEKMLPKNHPVIFELLNPERQVVERIVGTNGLNGFFNFKTKTDASAPTGNWTARVSVGNIQFTKTIKIEAIKPNRLKINIDFGKERLTSNDSENNINLSATWLHGAVAKNLNAKIAATLVQTTTKFEGYSQYHFDDPARSFSSSEQEIFDGYLDADGKASFTTDISVSDAAPGMLRANMVTRVFEKSGDFSIDRFSVPYAPYESFVGLNIPEGTSYYGALETGKDQLMSVVTLNDEGKPVSRENLEYSVYKLEWRWWWNSNGDDLARYLGSSYKHHVTSGKISTDAKGKANFKVKVDENGWGRYFIRVCDPVSGHCTGKRVYFDWGSWGRRKPGDIPGGSQILAFMADKDKYNVGETAKINFPSSGVGRALISVESGSKVLKNYWVEAKPEQTNFSLEITKDMAPNVYVHITLVQPHAQTKNDLPIRMYGVIPLMVEDPNTKLQPKLTMPDVLAPEEKFTVKVSETNGKDMTYSIAVVDEGLLDLTRFKTPNPWDKFYAREALGVKTWDMYDDVLGAYGGKIEQMYSIGGDEEGGEKGSKKANRFKPVVKFIGPFYLKKGATNSHDILMPNYVGSVRTMIVAGQEPAYGNAEKTTPVRKPLMVLATLPRVVGPGEDVTLPVTVFAMEKQIKNVQIKIETNDLLEPQDGTSKTIRFSKPDDQVVDFKLKVPEKIGIGKVKVTVTSGSEKATYEVELDVRNPNPPVVDVVDGVMDAGETWNQAYKIVGIEGTNEITMEVSDVPPIDFTKRLDYLVRYPHGCIEQTTSSVFPQLYLSDIMDINQNRKDEIERNINAGIRRLKSFQRSDGGLSYWPGGYDSDEWGSCYGGHFMLEAEKKGYTLPIGFKKNWIKFQSNLARQWTVSRYTNRGYYDRSDFIQAYRLYTLALAKAPEMGAMNRLREKTDLSDGARWRLAAAYAMAGQPETAKKLIVSAPRKVAYYRELSYTYGSSYRDEAMILETLTLMGERKEAFDVLKSVSEALGSDRWMSTQTTAYSLIAVTKYSSDQTAGNLKYEYSLNGKSYKKTSTKHISTVTLPSNASGSITLKNTSGKLMYARIISKGIPTTGDQTSAENGVKMYITYTDMEGNAIDVSKLQQGTDFKAKVTLTNLNADKYYREMSLTQIFPSGWEIHNSRLDGFKSVHTQSTPDYLDIRDDRVYTYYHLTRGETKTFVVLLNAAYEGRFYLPTVYTEAMYDNTINARKPGQWVEVVKSGVSIP